MAQWDQCPPRLIVPPLTGLKPSVQYEDIKFCFVSTNRIQVEVAQLRRRNRGYFASIVLFV